MIGQDKSLPDEKNISSSSEVAKLLQQLEQERQKSDFIICNLNEQLDVARNQIQNSDALIAQLTAQLEAERQINDVEWEQFFINASLKNTITGEPICCQEDFFRWKKQIEDSNQENRTGQNRRKKSETSYLCEAKDGSLVRVPENRLDAWSKAQSEPPQPLTEREQQIKKEILNKLYGPANHESQSSPCRMKYNDPERSDEDYWDGLLEYVDGLPRPKEKKRTEPSLPAPTQKTVAPKITASSKRTTSNVPKTNSPPSPPAKKHKAVVPLFCIASIVIVLFGTFLFGKVVHNPGVKSSNTYIGEQSKPVSDTRSSKTESNYIGSIKSSVIHKRTCRHAQKIIPENRIYYDTIQDAIEDGREKCSACFATQ